ncbi:hypothetical protein HHK36_030695 [Tetracentron sinense]|uniref:Peptidase C14 caspase domain-containing protein n=1 Tax=Tetracentron sinense TaxID=13715 RepID=A0A835CYY3_TETSI|nr:hypothetical protein HHK36_030695 [Tetracentron sinense]
MAGSKEKCLSCGEQQRVSPEDRCNACQTVTQAPPNEVFGRTQGQVPRLEIRNLIRGFLRRKINQLTSSVNNYTASMLPYRSQGRKRALLCGVSYKGNIWELHGTINDVHCMRYFLVEKLGFPDDSILILTEEETDPTKTPTKRNIQKALKWLVEGCKSGDSLVFHYSGHGIQKRNLTGDELDGYDESLCPVDYVTEGVILDDEINETIVQPLTQGVHLHAIIDACHSGTALDLPFVYKINRRGKFEWESHEPKSGANKGTSGGLAISFSACEDDQTSNDTDALSEDSAMTGVMTYCFIEVLLKEPELTYGQLLKAMRRAIRKANSIIGFGITSPLLRRLLCTRFSQEPILSSSTKFDIDSKQFLL